MLKLRENPPMLPPCGHGVLDLEGAWWVARTRSRCEKALAFDLLARNIAYYLPMVRRVTFSGGRRRHALIPLFPSYVFICGTEADRCRALTANRVVQTLFIRQQDAFKREIGIIDEALHRDPYLQAFDGIGLGERCRVRSGPFAGIEGMAVQRGAKTFVVLSITELFGVGASLEIEADLLEVVT